LTGRHARLRRDRRVARRLSWGVADQAVSSLENFLLGVYVARTMGVASLGALSLALIAYAVVLNVSRALSTDAVVVRYSATSKERWGRAVASSGGVALVVGAVGGAFCLAVGTILSGPDYAEAGTALIALGVVLPGLTFQDSWRYAFFAAGEGGKTFLNDVAWTVLFLAALVMGEFAGLGGITWAMLAYGGTAMVAGLFGVAQAHIVPRLRGMAGWLREHRDLWSRFLVENVVLGTSGQIRSVVVAVTAGIAAAGAIRGAEMLIGPVAALLMGIAQVAVPEAARSLVRGRSALRRLSKGLSLGLASVALAWGLVVLTVFPLGIGRLLLGDVWADSRVLVPGVIVSATAGCLHVGPSAGLRALGRADLTLACQLTVTFLFVALGAAGAVGWGALGAVWGTAIASTVGAGVWWHQLEKALRQHVTADAAGDSVSAYVHATAPGRE
jgi:O-antigen/teichoic acid export membrane protein